jgi:hypothetical protein
LRSEVRPAGFTLREDESLELAPALFRFAGLGLAQLLVELQFFLAAFLVARAEVGLRQMIVGIGIVGIQADGRLKLRNGLRLAALRLKTSTRDDYRPRQEK